MDLVGRDGIDQVTVTSCAIPIDPPQVALH